MSEPVASTSSSSAAFSIQPSSTLTPTKKDFTPKFHTAVDSVFSYEFSAPAPRPPHSLSCNCYFCIEFRKLKVNLKGKGKEQPTSRHSRSSSSSAALPGSRPSTSSQTAGDTQHWQPPIEQPNAQSFVESGSSRSLATRTSSGNLSLNFWRGRSSSETRIQSTAASVPARLRNAPSITSVRDAAGAQSHSTTPASSSFPLSWGFGGRRASNDTGGADSCPYSSQVGHIAETCTICQSFKRKAIRLGKRKAASNSTSTLNQPNIHPLPTRPQQIASAASPNNTARRTSSSEASVTGSSSSTSLSPTSSSEHHQPRPSRLRQLFNRSFSNVSTASTGATTPSVSSRGSRDSRSRSLSRFRRPKPAENRSTNTPEATTPTPSPKHTKSSSFGSSLLTSFPGRNRNKSSGAGHLATASTPNLATDRFSSTQNVDRPQISVSTADLALQQTISSGGSPSFVVTAPSPRPATPDPEPTPPPSNDPQFRPGPLPQDFRAPRTFGSNTAQLHLTLEAALNSSPSTNNNIQSSTSPATRAEARHSPACVSLSTVPFWADPTANSSTTVAAEDIHLPDTCDMPSAVSTPDGPNSYGSSKNDPLQIKLDSDLIVLRGIPGQEFEPARLSGELYLNLDDDVTFKEIGMTLNGKALIGLPDSPAGGFRSHFQTFPLFFHDFQFLSPNPSSTSHSHTLSRGRHTWPFSVVLPGGLPATLRTYTGTCSIEYKLKATAVRKGVGRDYKAKANVTVCRMLSEESVEFNRTLEIENTWPGKVLYSITIPHKAYAVGDEIPVSLKFSPVTKGTTVTSVLTTLREQTTVHPKGHTYQEGRDVVTMKHILRRLPNGFYINDRGEEISSGFEAISVNPWTPTPPASPEHSPRVTPADGSNSYFSRAIQNNPALDNFSLRPGSSSASNNASPPNVESEEASETNVVAKVPIPTWVTPSHGMQPAIITHKLKWSAFIRNPDGHTSELRCALPIVLLNRHLLQESRLASEGARNLLFGPSGALVSTEYQAAELPSYNEHVHDRVANAAELTSYFAAQSQSSFQPTSWAAAASGQSTPRSTPFQSPSPSRPPSPSGGRRTHSHTALSSLANMTPDQIMPRPNPEEPSASTSSTPPTSTEESGRSINWADQELVRSLGSVDLQPSHRPESQPNTPSPEPPTINTPPPPAPVLSSSVPSSSSTMNNRRGKGVLHGFTNPLRPFAAFTSKRSHQGSGSVSGNSSARQSLEQLSNVGGSSLSAPTTPVHNRPGFSFFVSDQSGPSGSGSGRTAGSSPTSPTNEREPAADHEDEGDGVETLSRVPSYSVASRGFLGGGVVPLESRVGLPDYEPSINSSTTSIATTSTSRI